MSQGVQVGPLHDDGVRYDDPKRNPFHGHLLSLVGRKVRVKGQGAAAAEGVLLVVSLKDGHVAMRTEAGVIATIFSPQWIEETEPRRFVPLSQAEQR